MFATPAVQVEVRKAVAGTDAHLAVLPATVALPSAWAPAATVTIPGIAPVIRSGAHWTSARPPPRLLG
jgi:hypothetical protein